MCGIVAIHGYDNIDSTLLKKMCDVIIHRGPDDYGYYIDDNTGIAMRRLSIIDLNTGSQPIFNENGNIALVCNGEIYNFALLRKELEKAGHQFSTKSDVEVIIHLYEQYGLDFINHLNGMFAFALYDKVKKKIIAARDRLGVKPLYYSFKNNKLILASELKSIIAANLFSLSLNYSAVDLFLQFQFIPSPYTIFNEVNKLLPGHFIVLNKGELIINKYWDIAYAPKIEMDQYTIKEYVSTLLKDAVQKRLTSDVPFGAFLSGGVDSSAIVAHMSKILHRPVRTFSIGFQHDHQSELKYARQIAKRYNTDHHEYIINPYDIEELLYHLIRYFDEPFADSSAIPTYVVSKLASKDVKMVLSGDGADESFAGYWNYQYYTIVRYLQKAPKSVRVIFSTLLENIAKNTSSNTMLNKLNRLVKQSFLSVPQQWEVSRSQFLFPDKLANYSQRFKEKLLDKKMHVSCYQHIIDDSLDPIDTFLSLDFKLYLTDGILVKVDRMSMANSLEVRSPFLDYRLVEFAALLPVKFKLRFLNSKFILKEALREVLPKEIIFRKKTGFSMPLAHWFRNDLLEYSKKMLLSEGSQVKFYFRDGFIEKLISDHKQGKSNNEHKIWSLLNLELWHKQFQDIIGSSF